MTKYLKLTALWLIIASAINNAETVISEKQWHSVIRSVPYYSTNGITNDLKHIRRWVLASSGYCAETSRHILFNRVGRFIGWMSNLESAENTQAKLNQQREKLFKQARVQGWIAGSDAELGYPFALSCDQPYVDLNGAMNRLLGTHSDYLVWGTWDTMVAGSKDNPIALSQMARQVWDFRQSQLNEPLEAFDFSLFLSQLLIESGARKSARSVVNAIGILQLREQVLIDCNIPERHWQHRMAQVDCAVRLYVMNRRNLQEVFIPVFGHLPSEKQNRLFSILLMQTYHSGIGNMRKLFLDELQSKATTYYAKHHVKYSAEDIATSMIYHNLGREPWGWESLYYLIDIEITEEILCTRMLCR